MDEAVLNFRLYRGNSLEDLAVVVVYDKQIMQLNGVILEFTIGTVPSYSPLDGSH